MRVLLSARDPGAAGHLIPVAKALAGDLRCELRVAAHGRALPLFREAGVAVEPFGEFEGLGQDPRAGVLAEARRQLEAFRPEVVLTGVSSLGFGADEAFLAEARVPTFAFQDIWGEANLDLGVAAGTYLVLDDHAAQLTRARYGVPCEVVGSPKHAAYAQLGVAGLRAECRQELGAGPEPVLGFFGQCADQPGYEENVIALFDVLAGRALLVREHPKTSAATVQRFRGHAEKRGIRVFDATNRRSAEAWLTACDLVLTPFSTCGIDHAYLSARSPEPIGTVLYVMVSEALRKFREGQVSSYRFPLLDQGIGELVEDAQAILPAVHRLTGPAARAEYHRRTRELVPGDPVTRIVNWLLSPGKTPRF